MSFFVFYWDRIGQLFTKWSKDSIELLLVSTSKWREDKDFNYYMLHLYIRVLFLQSH